MTYLVVSSLAALPATVTEHGALDVVTLIDEATVVERPASVEAHRHLFLGMNDIVEPTDGLTLPADPHVDQLLEFGRRWDRETPLAVHCHAGISRSTAAAYILALAINPELDEDALARELRRRAPSATPNGRLIALADAKLGRGGRMVRAIAGIGRGEDAFAGTPFVLPPDVLGSWMGEPQQPLPVEVGLNAAIVAVADAGPLVLVVPAHPASAGPGGPDGLPFGPFDPLRHRTFEAGLRTFVGEQTGLSLGYVEQLYTFGDRGRHRAARDASPHVVSVGYLALARIDAADPVLEATGAVWRSFYRYFPWEDARAGRPAPIEDTILQALERWATDGRSAAPARAARLKLAFGASTGAFDEERVLDRYELMYEAGLVEEAVSDGRYARVEAAGGLGVPMRFDHRRILATAIARLRAKLKYRPVIFELLPAAFTLTELQSVVEAIAGRHIHKQNFRRFVETTQLVEPTGQSSAATGGRPAALFRFRQEVLNERPSPGIRLGRG